jgi:transcription antitermination factor NusG
MVSQTVVSHLQAVSFAEPEPWYAVRTKPRHEKSVARQLEMEGLENYLPLLQQSRQWTDRTKVIDLPLFPGYVFVRIPDYSSRKVQVLRKAGVLGFVKNDRGAMSIPDSELNGVRLLVANRIPHASHPYLEVGQRIRITDGVLRGVEGILVGLANKTSKQGLVVSVDLIQRSLVIQLQGYGVEVIEGSNSNQ